MAHHTIHLKKIRVFCKPYRSVDCNDIVYFFAGVDENSEIVIFKTKEEIFRDMVHFIKSTSLDVESMNFYEMIFCGDDYKEKCNRYFELIKIDNITTEEKYNISKDTFKIINKQLQELCENQYRESIKMF